MSGTATGYQRASSNNSDLNAHVFTIDQRISTMWTAMPVTVQAVNPGAGNTVGTVDVLPMVNQHDGAGNAVPHGTIYGLPYSRVQAGTSAVLLDPVVGDNGVAVFCMRDISAVKASGAQNVKGSNRSYDPADGIYVLTAISSPTPTNFIDLRGGNITLTTPGIFTVNAASMVINAATVMHDGKNIGYTHVHSGVEAGPADTGPPV